MSKSKTIYYDHDLDPNINNKDISFKILKFLLYLCHLKLYEIYHTDIRTYLQINPIRGAVFCDK